MIRGQTASRVLVSAAVAAILIIAAGALLGARGWAAASAISLLWVAWRHDNEFGVLPILAILFLIVIAVMCLLIYLMRITHPR